MSQKDIGRFKNQYVLRTGSPHIGLLVQRKNQMIKKNYNGLSYEVYGPNYYTPGFVSALKELIGFFVAISIVAMVLAGISCFFYVSCMTYIHGLKLF